jgi:metal-sulfur cluster biosynthetic enzyme
MQTNSVTENQVLNVLRAVLDPEIGVNIVDLGLVYHVDLQDGGISVTLTMTSPTCPLGEMILNDAYFALSRRFPQADDIRLNLVWSPPWSPERMSVEAKAQLGWAG